MLEDDPMIEDGDQSSSRGDGESSIDTSGESDSSASHDGPESESDDGEPMIIADVMPKDGSNSINSSGSSSRERAAHNDEVGDRKSYNNCQNGSHPENSQPIPQTNHNVTRTSSKEETKMIVDESAQQGPNIKHQQPSKKDGAEHVEPNARKYDKNKPEDIVALVLSSSPLIHQKPDLSKIMMEKFEAPDYIDMLQNELRHITYENLVDITDTELKMSVLPTCYQGHKVIVKPSALTNLCHVEPSLLRKARKGKGKNKGMNTNMGKRPENRGKKPDAGSNSATTNSFKTDRPFTRRPYPKARRRNAKEMVQKQNGQE